MYRLTEKMGLTGEYFLFLSLSNNVQEAELFWCHGFHVDWETWPGTSQALGKGKSLLIQVKREGKEAIQANISREKETRGIFPQLVESNPLEKMNI